MILNRKNKPNPENTEPGDWCLDFRLFRLFVTPKGGEFMETLRSVAKETQPVPSITYKGQVRSVEGTRIRWLSKAGDDGSGHPEYGLRYFEIDPGGEIPIHNHFYHQTMYFISGRAECYEYDAETEEITARETVGPGDAVYIPGMEPHGMKPIGDEPVAFLCCIANVYEK
jgi:quercetin dioxygenase-like cupin family protein